MNNKFKSDEFERVPIIGILRNFPSDKIERSLESFHAAGLTTIEMTLNSSGAREHIEQMVARWGDKLNIGAGTVCNLEDLDVALSAGAQFIVTPIINEEVITACVTKGVPIFPGAFTPSEIYKAWSLGASMVKVFPASRLGPEYFKDILQPLNKLKLIATGGVTKDNFMDFLRAGAKGVGIGSNLFPKEMLDNNKWGELTDFLKGIANEASKGKQ